MQHARAALDRGDAAAAASGARAFIAMFPGDPNLADAQWLLGLALEQAGAWGAAWEQYGLFILNFPAHPARPAAVARAEALVQRATARILPMPTRWRLTRALGASGPTGDVAEVLAFPASAGWESMARQVTRAALDGGRVWVWRPLGTASEPFDPFDEAHVARLEREFRAMAAWPVEGFVIDGALHVGEWSHRPAAAGAYRALAREIVRTAADPGRLTWTWAGTRARASARALRRFVAGAEAVNPRMGWIVRLSPSAILSPERAVRESGEDLAELRRAAPGAVWAIDGAAEATSRLAARLDETGAEITIAVWTAGNEIVLLQEQRPRPAVPGASR